MLGFLRWRFLNRMLRTNAIQKGLFGGNRFWTGVLVAGLAGRQVNKVLKRGEMPIRFSERLEPGQSFVITHLPDASSRRSRRRSR